MVNSKTNTITIDLTTGASNSYTTRTLTSGAFTLNYNLYLDAAYTEVWGDGTGGSVVDTVTLTRNGNGNGNGNKQANATATIYGSVAALQDATPGTYTDTITVTVNY